MLFELPHELLEPSTPMLVVLELVEARACRSQQNGVARPRAARCDFDGALNRSRALDAHVLHNLFFDLVRGRADQQRERRLFARSEEHTSELQSRLHLVCRLLLEKKKKRSQNTP